MEEEYLKSACNELDCRIRKIKENNLLPNFFLIETLIIQNIVMQILADNIYVSDESMFWQKYYQDKVENIGLMEHIYKYGKKKGFGDWYNIKALEKLIEEMSENIAKQYGGDNFDNTY